MREEVYNYLRQYGFSKEDLNNFENLNYKIFEINYDIAKYNVEFLESKGLSKEEILDVVKKNVFLLTVHKKKLEELDKIYIDILNFTKEEIKQLIITNPDTYIENPIKLEELINVLKETKTNEEIRQLIMLNPNLLNTWLE